MPPLFLLPLDVACALRLVDAAREASLLETLPIRGLQLSQRDGSLAILSVTIALTQLKHTLELAVKACGVLLTIWEEHTPSCAAPAPQLQHGISSTVSTPEAQRAALHLGLPRTSADCPCGLSCAHSVPCVRICSVLQQGLHGVQVPQGTTVRGEHNVEALGGAHEEKVPWVLPIEDRLVEHEQPLAHRGVCQRVRDLADLKAAAQPLQLAHHACLPC